MRIPEFASFHAENAAGITGKIKRALRAAFKGERKQSSSKGTSSHQRADLLMGAEQRAQCGKASLIGQRAALPYAGGIQPAQLCARDGGQQGGGKGRLRRILRGDP